MWCVLEVKGRAGRRPGGAVGLGSRGQGCASCWGRTFIKDGCILISVICDRTQSSCGKYVLTGPLRQRCRHVEAVGEPVGDTAANRLCSPNVRRARGARAVRCPHSGHERLHGHHASRKTAECCGSCAGPDAGAEFMSAAWTPPAGSAQIRQGTCLGTMPARSGWNWQRTVCFAERLDPPQGGYSARLGRYYPGVVGTVWGRALMRYIHVPASSTQSSCSSSGHDEPGPR